MNMWYAYEEKNNNINKTETAHKSRAYTFKKNKITYKIYISLCYVSSCERERIDDKGVRVFE